MTPPIPELFSVLEIANLLIVCFGMAIAMLALVDARTDLDVRREMQVDGRIILIGTRNFRNAWVLAFVLGLQIVYFVLSVLNPPTLGQRDPDVQIWFNYGSQTVANCLLLVLVYANYRDYRRALTSIQLEDPTQQVTTVTSTRIVEETSSAGKAEVPQTVIVADVAAVAQVEPAADVPPGPADGTRTPVPRVEEIG